MVNANELALGNWVYEAKHIKNPMKIVAISEYDVYFVDVKGDGPWESYPETIEGILITQELLEKMGFTPTLNGFWRKQSARREVTYNLERNILGIESFDRKYLENRGWLYNVKYVHELQNFHRCITKEEMEINL